MHREVGSETNWEGYALWKKSIARESSLYHRWNLFSSRPSEAQKCLLTFSPADNNSNSFEVKHFHPLFAFRRTSRFILESPCLLNPHSVTIFPEEIFHFIWWLINNPTRFSIFSPLLLSTSSKETGYIELARIVSLRTQTFSNNGKRVPDYN